MFQPRAGRCFRDSAQPPRYGPWADGSGMCYVRRSAGGETDDHRTRCAGSRLNNGAGRGPCQHDHRSSVRRGLRTSIRADCRGRTGTALSLGSLGPGVLGCSSSPVDLGRWPMALTPSFRPTAEPQSNSRPCQPPEPPKPLARLPLFPPRTAHDREALLCRR
jgi:hypothetical protein